MNRITTEDVKKCPEFKELNNEELNAIVEFIQRYNNIIYQLAMEKENGAAAGKIIEMTNIKTQAA